MNHKHILLASTILFCSAINIQYSFAMDSEPSKEEKEFNFQRSLLKTACRDGNMQMVNLIIAKLKENQTLDKALNETFDGEERPLDLACMKGHAEIVQILLQNGASLTVGPRGYTPLEYAVENNHLDVALVIMKHCERVSTATGKPLLISQAMNNRIQQMNDEAMENDSLIDAINDNDYHQTCTIIAEMQKKNRLSNFIKEHGTDIVGPLSLFALNGYDDLVSLFVKNGADVNAVNSENQSALHIAVVYNQFKVAQTLIDHGANIDLLDNLGDTPLMKACDKNLFDMVKLLVKNKAKIDCICHETIQKVNHQVIIQLTPLIVAVANNFSDIALHLINMGANVNYVTVPRNFSILHTACKVGNLTIIKALLSKNVNCNVETIDGLTPLDLLEKAENKKNITIIKQLLMERGIKQLTDEEANENMLRFIAELEQEQAYNKEAKEKKKEKNKKKKQRRKEKKKEEKNSAPQNVTTKNDDEPTDTNDKETEDNDIDSLSDTLSITSLSATPTPTAGAQSSASSSTQSIANSSSSSYSSSATPPTSTAANRNSSLSGITSQGVSSSSSAISRNAPSSSSQTPISNVSQASTQQTQIPHSSRPYQVLVDKKNFAWPKTLKGNQKDNLREHLLKLRNWPNHGCDVKSMKNKPNVYRLRVGGYRAIFEVDTLNKQIRVLSLNLRKVAYRFS